MESFTEKLTRLREEQRQRDEQRQAERPLQPTGVSHAQGMLNRRAREETARSIELEVELLSDRDPRDPIREYAEKLKAESKFASASRKEAIRNRLKVLSIEIEKREAAAVEANRIESFKAHSATILAAEALKNLTYLTDVPPEEIEKLKTIVGRADLWTDPATMSARFWEHHDALLEKQIAIDTQRREERVVVTNQNLQELQAADDKLKAAKAKLSKPEEPPPGEPDAPSE